MNILYIIGGKGVKYGAEVVASNLIENLSRDYNVHYTVVINAKGVISELCEKHNIEYYVVKLRQYVYAKPSNPIIDFLKKNILLLRAMIDDAAALKKLERNIDFSEIDIVHTNLSRNFLGAKISRKYKVPHIWHIQEMVNSHYKLNFLMNDQIQYMNRNADIFIGISNTVLNDWIRHGINKEKCHTVLNGVNNDFIRISNRHKVFKLIMIAEITHSKGQEFVIDAISRLSSEERMKVSLDIVGNGNQKYIKKLKDKIKMNGLESRVKFRGYIENASSILPAYDILINASEGEGFGLSTAEAMMNSVCPLVSNKGANVELVKDRVTGAVYKFGGVEHFISSLLYLLNDQVISELSSNAREYAMGHFSVQRQMKEIYSLYKMLL